MIGRIRLALLGAAVATTFIVGSVLADPGTKVIDASMVGIPPASAGQTLLGVAGGGIAWTLDKGSAKLYSNGHLEVDVDHLVLAAGPAIGTNPVPTGRAIVVCNADTIVMTDTVPFSPDGNAKVRTDISLPSPCLAPVIFFAGQTGAGPRWFAVTGG